MSSFNFMPVLLGGDANAYGMARSFYEEYCITSRSIGKGAFHICQNSKLMSLDIVEPNLEDDAVFVETLTNFARAHAHETKLLVPCGDNYTKMLVRNQDALRDYYRFTIMSPDLYDLVCTKERFYETCKKHGLSFPDTCEVDSESAADFVAPFSYPLIVKPSNSVAWWNCSFPGKKKVFVVNNDDELRRIFAGAFSSSYDDTLIVQDFVPGDDSYMRVVNCYSDAKGQVKMMALGEVLLEEHTPEGIGSYGAIMTGYDEEIFAKVRGFLEEIGYVGFSNFDLKFDMRDNTYKLFEINPRQGRSSYFTTASGKNLARYLVRDAILEKDEPCEYASLDDEVLWTMIPLSVIRKYVSNESAKKRAEALISKGKVVRSYWSADDKSFMRWISYQVNQHNYRKQYKTSFNKRGIDD